MVQEIAEFSSSGNGVPVLLDTGCSSSGLMTLEAAEGARESCMEVNASRRRRYGFADGNAATSSSTALFTTLLGVVPLDVVERPGKTCLLGTGWLRQHEAKICLSTNTMRYRDDHGSWSELQWGKANNGHLYLASATFFSPTTATAATAAEPAPDVNQQSEVAASSMNRNKGSEPSLE